MIIEFFGLPATGKTTCAKNLELGGFQIIKIRSKAELFFGNASFFVSYPLKFFVNFFYILLNSVNLKNFYIKLTNCFLNYNAKFQKAKKNPRSILDQGHFQNIISVLEKKVSENYLREYIEAFPRPDLLVVFVSSINAIKQRAEERNYFGREEFGYDYLVRWQEAILANNDLFLKILPELRLKYFLISVDQETDPAKKILEQIGA